MQSLSSFAKKASLVENLTRKTLLKAADREVELFCALLLYLLTFLLLGQIYLGYPQTLIINSSKLTLHQGNTMISSTSNLTGQDQPRISSRISYECHNLLMLADLKTLDLDDGSDDEDSDYDTDSEASESDNEDYFGFDSNDGNASSSKAFQYCINARQANANMNAMAFLTGDSDTAEETKQGTNKEREMDDHIIRRISQLNINDDGSENICHAAHGCNVEMFERQSIDKMIRMGKIREHNTEGKSCFARFQYIRRSNIPSTPLH